MTSTPPNDAAPDSAAVSVDLSAELGPLTLPGPMLTASGTCGYALEYDDLADLSRLGAFVTKSITREVRPGNESYRIVETRGGMLNAIGLANVGLEVFLRDKLPDLAALRERGPRIIVNVAGHSEADYVEASRAVAAESVVDGVELNVSCPNVADGLTFGADCGLLRDLVGQVRGVMPAGKPLIVKLSPNVGDVTATARAAIEGGADVLSMINTYTAMVVDVQTGRPRLANGTGGLSGPAVRPLAVHLVSRVHREVARPAGVPIIGMGGIQGWQDAAQFVLAGASALAVGTALFVDPATPQRVERGLGAWVASQGRRSLRELVGTLRMPGDADRPAPFAPRRAGAAPEAVA